MRPRAAVLELRGAQRRQRRRGGPRRGGAAHRRLAAFLPPDLSRYLYTFGGWRGLSGPRECSDGERGGGAVAVDRFGNAYVTGVVFGPLLPTTPGTIGGGYPRSFADHAFVARVQPAPTPPPASEESALGFAYGANWAEEESEAFSGGRARVSETVGAEALLTFTGTAVQVLGRRSPDGGRVNVFMDGVPATGFDCYGSPAEPRAVLLSMTFAGPQTHTITLEVAFSTDPRSTGRRVVIDGFDVVP